MTDSVRVPKRVFLDINEMQEEIIKQQGISYKCDETNVMQGWLLIWGPQDTPYEDMPMVYEIVFPNEYPFDPPKVNFITSDGFTRFHPNMYREGKVCLSILGTWTGPRWAATLRLSTAAISIQSLMDCNPIAHEPGYEKRTDELSVGYNHYVAARCALYLVDLIEAYANGRLEKRYPNVDLFLEEFEERLPRIVDRLRSRLTTSAAANPEDKHFTHLPYGMAGVAKYGEWLQRLEDAVAKIDTVVMVTNSRT